MKKKKIMALIMAVVMILGISMCFTACGETETGDSDQAAASEDEATAEENATAPTEDTSEVVQAVNEYVDLAGEYQDETSQRASATVIANTESRSVNITVTWGTSATETTEWTMNAVKEGNQLVYSDCVKQTKFESEDLDEEGTGDEDGMGGGAKDTVEYEGGSGSFEISGDGKLLWTGAADADCTGCVFVKVTE